MLRTTYFEESQLIPVTIFYCLYDQLNGFNLEPGWAVAEAEERKDVKYYQRIEEAGGHFVSLVVEAFGRWSPCAS